MSEEHIFTPTSLPLQELSTFRGYQSQYQEIMLDNLNITGNVPKWLSGSMIANGPAQFEVGTTHFNHWFDGFAMLKKFTFKSGKVSFQNRFLQSNQYKKSNASGQLYRSEFGTWDRDTILGHLWNIIKRLVQSKDGGYGYDNCNVNIVRIAQHFIAMTESSSVVEFELDDLSTIGSFTFNDNLRGQLSTAHPHLDVDTGEIINIAIEVGRQCKYHIYKIVPNSSLERQIIQTYVSDTLFYMHSFNITPNYIVLFQSPLTFSKLKLIFNYPVNHALSWQKGSPSYFIVVNRKNGAIQKIATDPFFCIHSVNAYERNNEIILDLICHDQNPYDDLYLPNVQHKLGMLRRYIIDLYAKKCRYTILSNHGHEFPIIHYNAVNGKEYKVLYTNAITKSGKQFFNAIQKFDLRKETVKCWEQEGYYPGEVIFVPKNNNQSQSGESDGVLLSIAYNESNQCSSLIILDADTMEQSAEVLLPMHLPFGLHGHFYSH